MAKTNAVIVPVTPFPQNCTLLWCEVTKRAVVIDPGGRKTIFEPLPGRVVRSEFFAALIDH
jgi:hypothetical protein